MARLTDDDLARDAWLDQQYDLLRATGVAQTEAPAEGEEG